MGATAANSNTANSLKVSSHGGHEDVSIAIYIYLLMSICTSEVMTKVI